MNVAIVARGPTHARIVDRYQDIDTIIGVNHAAGWYPCDWWCFGDLEAWREIQPVGDPRWFTCTRTIDRMNSRAIRVPESVLAWEDVRADMRPEWYSAVAALILAKHIGAKSITCFGVVDEHPAPGELPRWERERRIWNETIQCLAIPTTRG